MKKFGINSVEKYDTSAFYHSKDLERMVEEL